MYNDVCVSKLLYGIELLNASPQTVDKLEDFNVHAAKNVQGLPDQASNCGSLHTIGWHSVNCRIDIMKLLFMWRVLLLPMENIYKIVMLRRMVDHIYSNKSTKSGPSYEMLELCKSVQFLILLLHVLIMV